MPYNTYVPDATSVDTLKYATGFGDYMYVQASGTVPTSGWSGVFISPRFFVNPPADGVWVMDLYGHPPAGMALQVELPVAANVTVPCPDWVKGVKIQAANNYVESPLKVVPYSASALDQTVVHANAVDQLAGRAIVIENLATYDDSHQPIGFCSGFGSIKMKKLRHQLTLIIDGPDERKIRKCIQEAIAAGLVAAIIAVFATGGGALSAAISAAISYLETCLGGSFNVRIERKSHWIEWCT